VPPAVRRLLPVSLHRGLRVSATGRLKSVGTRGIAPLRLPEPKSGGSAVLREPRARQNGAGPETCTLLPGLQDPRIAIYAWPADGIRTPDVRLIFYRTQAAQLRKGAGKMAGTTGLAPARISAVTGRHLGYFGLVPVKLRHFHKAGTPGRNSTCISDVRSVALFILSYEGIQNGAGGWCCPSDLFSVNEALSC
jgi:hypothetical protein